MPGSLADGPGDASTSLGRAQHSGLDARRSRDKVNSAQTLMEVEQGVLQGKR